MLLENFKDFKNISIIPKALGDGAMVKMVFNQRWSGSDSVVNDRDGNIETISISDILPQNVDNFILKVDCEGGEKYLLNSDPGIFKKCVYFTCEFHENNDNNIIDWENWLKNTFDTNYITTKKSLGKDLNNNLYLYHILRDL